MQIKKCTEKVHSFRANLIRKFTCEYKIYLCEIKFIL